MQALGQLANKTNLLELNISQNNFETQGMIVIAKALWNMLDRWIKLHCIVQYSSITLCGYVSICRVHVPYAQKMYMCYQLTNIQQ